MFAVDFVSAPFVMSKLQIYEGHDDPDTFFRPALRCFLVGAGAVYRCSVQVQCTGVTNKQESLCYSYGMQCIPNKKCHGGDN